MHPSGEVGRFQMDNFSSPPGDFRRYVPLSAGTLRPQLIAGDLIRGYCEYFDCLRRTASLLIAGNLRSHTAQIARCVACTGRSWGSVG